MALTVATANRVADASRVKLTGAPDYRIRGGRRRAARNTGIGASLMPILVLLFVLSSLRRRRHRTAWGGRGAASGFLMGALLGSLLGGGGRGLGRRPWAAAWAAGSEEGSAVPSGAAAGWRRRGRRRFWRSGAGW